MFNSAIVVIVEGLALGCRTYTPDTTTLTLVAYYVYMTSAVLPLYIALEFSEAVDLATVDASCTVTRRSQQSEPVIHAAGCRRHRLCLLLAHTRIQGHHYRRLGLMSLDCAVPRAGGITELDISCIWLHGTKRCGVFLGRSFRTDHHVASQAIRLECEEPGRIYEPKNQMLSFDVATSRTNLKERL
jgi:hypothetical protein